MNSASLTSHHEAILIYEQGIQAYEKQDINKAMDLLQCAIQKNAYFFEAYYCLGTLYLEKNEYEAALPYLKKAVALNSENPDALYNLGLTYLRMELWADAIAFFEQVSQKNPNYVEAYINLSAVYRQLNNAEKALFFAEKSISLSPHYVEALINISTALLLLNRLREAKHYCQQALKNDPHNALAHTNLGIIHLVQGNYLLGWPEYEWRLQQNKTTPIKGLANIPSWRGENISHQHLLIQCEQGYGDCILFSRFIPLIKKHVKQLTLLCPGALKNLFSVNFSDICCVISYEDTIPVVDYQVPLLSLGWLLQIELEKLPYFTQYLKTIPSSHKKRMVTKKLQVGFAWRGNPKNLYNPSRSCDLSYWDPLLKNPAIQYYSFQKEATAQELGSYKNRIINAFDECDDFLDCATLIETLDLVITIDTALAHLSGALEKTTWVLLPYAAPWQWEQNTIQSHWYPCVRLFRQKTPDDWNSVIKQIANELVNFREERRKLDG